MYDYYFLNKSQKELSLCQRVVRCSKIFWSTAATAAKNTAEIGVIVAGVLTFPFWWSVVCWYNKKQSDKQQTCSGENRNDGKTEGRESTTEIHI